MNQQLLTIEQILTWAEAHRLATGEWPTRHSGRIPGTLFETWNGIDMALRRGTRGLPRIGSLAQLLADKKGGKRIRRDALLTEEQILQWADAHFQRTGSWPTAKSGLIPGTNETWQAIDVALHSGARGLPGGSSLPKLLALHRGVRNRKNLPPLTEEQILAWADHHHEVYGSWPNSHSGPVAAAPGETWMAIEMALSHGQRGLPGGSSLAKLLAEKRGVPNKRMKPQLTIEMILSWADSTFAKTGKWPNANSGPVADAPEETWNGINRALTDGTRGLPGGSSLAQLLADKRGVRNKANIPRLYTNRILAWADAHFHRHGTWPTIDSGPIPEAPGETWERVHHALVQGNRGLCGGSSLAQFLAKYRGKRNVQDLPRLSKRKILAWADAHFQRTGKWPASQSCPVVDAPGENWHAIDAALRRGNRGLPGGSSLHRLLVKKRGIKAANGIKAACS